MKDFRGMKRQRSRNRKPSGSQNNPNRAYESNGPEGTKVRGNAQTIYEKYQQLARDANSSGDRVLAENHLQHAEHYFRLIRQMQPMRPVSEFVQRDPFSNGYDDFDDEFEMMEGGETEAEAVAGEGDQPSVEDREARENGRNRDRFDRNDRNRDRNDRNDRNRDRNDRNRDNGTRDNGTRDNGNRENVARDTGRDNVRSDRVPYEPREPREPRVFEPRAETRAETEEPLGEFDGRRESRRERYERRRQQRLSEQEQNVNVPTSPGFIASTEPLGGAPVSRPAPEPVSEQPAIRDDLPAFLNRPTPVAAAPVADEAEEPAKPKRGRPKRKTEAATEEA